MVHNDLQRTIESLLQLPIESEWVEFKHNFHSPEEIGKDLSALANGADLKKKPFGYIVFGVKDETREVVGTNFFPSKKKVGNEEIENWLAQRLSPRADFSIYEFDFNGCHLTIFKVDAALHQPVCFSHEAYVRVGSITRKLREFPEKERKIWKAGEADAFEKGIALPGLSEQSIVDLLDIQSYFDLIELPYPTSREAVLHRLQSEGIIIKDSPGWGVTNLGALLFAKKMGEFPTTISRKAVRVIVYDGKNKVKTKRDITGSKGYAAGFEELIRYINDQLPSSEDITQALRTEVKVFPEIAIRELVANGLIHQDFHQRGIGPMVEIFDDRIEISNPGQPLIDPMRFIDEYQSRNEILANLMRRLRICEEKGSGVDKVIHFIELFQLPAPNFKIQETHTKVVLFAPLSLNEMDKDDKIRACYHHCSLKYVSNEKMTNQSLRTRFNISEQNAAVASRIIRDTLGEGLIKEEDPSSRSRKYVRYIPWWA